MVKKEARLFDMNFNSLGKLGTLLDKDDIKVLINYYNIKELYVNPSGFTPADLAAYRANRSKHPNYLNRRMAEIVCRLGFDGWVVKPFDPKRRAGLIQISIYIEGGVLKTRKVPYTPEIMLCKWKDIMDLKSLSIPNNNVGAAAAAAGSAKKARRTRRLRR